MNWTLEKEPNEKVSYNHVLLETPIGEYIVDWKGWKENPSYDVSLEGIWLGGEYDLESAKKLAENHLIKTGNEINEFLKS